VRKFSRTVEKGLFAGKTEFEHPTGITKRLDRLSEAGLFERRPDPDDRRSALVRLTQKGRAVVDRMLEAHVANEERLLRPFSPADRRALDTLLRRLLASLDSSATRSRTQ
jgi:DNA-binding MarR family transcriptional regulator